MSKKACPTTTPDWGAVVKRRTRFYTLIAAILAVLFGILLYSSLSKNIWAGQTEQVSAVFAAEDIPPGMAISKEMLTEKMVPEELVPSPGFQYQEQVIGREAIFPLIKGEMILPGKLVGDRGGPISGRCPKEKWCIQVPESWFISKPPDLAEGDRIEIAAALPGDDPEKSGFVVVGGQVVFQQKAPEDFFYVLAVEDQEALSLLYAAANQFQLFVMVRPAGGN